MRISVVICTYNRAESLQHTLDALRYQTYHDFEVVVVNGPSTDRTDDVLDRWRNNVKVVSNPLANLSVSRNLGIRASAGELVAFIDDDAIPEFDWLDDIAGAFGDAEVAGVGGLVFDHTGVDFQFRFSASSRLGEPLLSDEAPFDSLCVPGAFWFPHLQGTNAAFRRAVLDDVGGFDETFDYYLDETDLCARIVDAGYVLRQLDDAHVHHKFLPSAVRTESRIVTNWYPILKNLTYFGVRHALADMGEQAIVDKAHAELAFRISESRSHEQAGRLPPGTADRVAADGARAIEEGLRRAAEAGDGPLPPMQLGSPPFQPFAVHEQQGRVIAVVSSSFGDSVNGGIARFLTDLIPQFVRFGHEVRVITRSTAHTTVDFEDGAWVHRISAVDAGGALPGTSAAIDGFATAALAEVERIRLYRPIDVVYGPAWDMEVLPIIRMTDIPTAVLLATPVAITNNLDGDAAYAPDPYASLLLALEHEIFEKADLLHADSVAVVATIAQRYPQPLDPCRVAVAALGSVDRSPPPPDVPRDDADSHTVEVLFVGRLEPRKGVDTLLEAIEHLAPELPQLHMTIAGPDNPGEADVRGPWQRRVGDEPWFGRVEFVGKVSDAELEELYGRADIVALPSRYESFGLTVVEAMRHGVAVVSTTAGAIPELVTDGVEGLLVAPDDSVSLAEAIRRLAIEPSRARSHGAGRTNEVRAGLHDRVGRETAPRRAGASPPRRDGRPERFMFDPGRDGRRRASRRPRAERGDDPSQRARPRDRSDRH